MICLKLDNCNLADTQGSQALGTIKINKSLEEIDLSHNKDSSEEFYIELVKIIKTNNKLKTVKSVQVKYNYDLKKLADIYSYSLTKNKTLK